MHFCFSRRRLMPKSRHPRHSSSIRASSPVNLGLHVAQQLITLLGGGGGRSSIARAALGRTSADPATAVLSELTRVLLLLQTAEAANTLAITANTAAKQSGF